MKSESDLDRRGGGAIARRRRGTALDDALLAAAWDELQGGYAAFTIDAVARAAGTSRAVVYRRWPSRAALVHAVVRAHAGSIEQRVPDTGSLASDVVILLHELAGRIDAIGIDVASGLLSELDEVPEYAKVVVPAVFEKVIDRARDRGEIGSAPIPDAVLSMPGVLIRYSMIIGRAAPSDEYVDHIASDLFLPLVRYHAALSPVRLGLALTSKPAPVLRDGLDSWTPD